MLTPNRYQSPAAYVRRSQRLLARTKGIEALAAAAAEFESAFASLQNRFDEWTQSRIDGRAALCARHEAEENLDHELRGVALVIFAAGHGRRANQAYRRYFPDGYGATLHRSMTEALGIAAGVIAAMDGETNEDIVRRRGRLESAGAVVQAAARSHQAAVNARSQAKAILEEEKVAWRTALVRFYFAARLAFPDRRSYLESLFAVNGRPGEIPPGQPEPDAPILREGGDPEESSHESTHQAPDVASDPGGRDPARRVLDAAGAGGSGSRGS